MPEQKKRAKNKKKGKTLYWSEGKPLPFDPIVLHGLLNMEPSSPTFVEKLQEMNDGLKQPDPCKVINLKNKNK